MKKKFYITNAIPYVNGKPHIGHALEYVQTDTIARYHRSILKDETFFLFGTDENALKNVQAAENADENVVAFVERHTNYFRDLLIKLNISNDDFIRTTEKRNIEGAQKLWKACQSSGDIYKKKYSGMYCVGCEEFKKEEELVEGLCPEHKKIPENVTEKNYFFRLSKYENELKKLIELDTLLITPPSRKNEALSFIKNGLLDFSISRPKERARGWGIEVPDDPSQVIYVWFDALSNYINALGYGKNENKFYEWWQNNETHKVHAIGKGIIKFHAIYWPAILISAGVMVPNELLVHGYITVEGEKISKSLGNVIDPIDVISKYGADVTRYYLLRDISPVVDGDFSFKRMDERYSSDLANNLGNLVSRTAKLIQTKLEGELIYKNQFMSERVLNEIEKTQLVYHQKMKEFKMHEALSDLWTLLSFANGYMDEYKPWSPETNPDDILKTLTSVSRIILEVSILLYPFMPDTADKIQSIFGVSKPINDWYETKLIVFETQPLFPRLEK